MTKFHNAHRISALRAAIAGATLMTLYSGYTLAQATATSGRNINPAVEEIIITEKSLETSLPLELARYGSDLEIVTVEQIRNHGFIDVSQSLEMLVPGLHLTTQAGAFSYVNVQMQGSRPSDILWAIDGVRINNRLYNSTSPADTLPSSMIERIEVLKGGQGLMYGTQAIAGVMNVVTRSFSDTNDGDVSVGAGSNGLRRMSINGRGALGNNKFVVWASRDESDGYEIYSEYQPTATHRKRGYDVDNVGLKYAYDFNPDLRLSLMGVHTEARLDYPGVGSVSVNDRIEDIFSARLDYTPSKETQFFLKSYYHDWDTDYYTPPNPSQYWGYDDFGMTAGGLFTPHETVELHLGYDFQTYKGVDQSLLIAGEREDVHAFYTQVRTTDALFEKARFSAGTRYNDTEGVSSTIWNVTGIYEFSAYLFVQGVVSTSFMLPSAENLYRIHCPSGQNCTHGNPNVEPEESFGLNLSVGGDLSLTERALSWQFNVWDRKIDNLITTAPVDPDMNFPPEFTRTFVNLPGEARMEGAEVLLRGPLTDALTFDVSYTYSKERAANSNVQLPDRPLRQYKGALSYVHPTLPFGLNLALKYVGDKSANVTGFGFQDYGDYHVIDMGMHVFLDGRDGNHRLMLRLENALGEEYATNVTSAVRTGSTERFMYDRLGPPRTVSMNYNYTF